MTNLEFSLEFPDCLAREAGLVVPEALTEMLESGLRQKTTERIRAARAMSEGGQPLGKKVVAEVRRLQP